MIPALKRACASAIQPTAVKNWQRQPGGYAHLLRR